MSVPQMQKSTSYVNETRLEATGHRNRRAGTAGDCRNSQQKSGERSMWHLTVRHGWRLLQMAVVGRFQHKMCWCSTAGESPPNWWDS